MVRRLVLMAGVCLTAVGLGAQAPERRLSIEDLVDIRHPSSAMWSPDGRSVVFVWDRAGVSTVHVADVSGASPPRPLPEAGSQLNGTLIAPDGKALLVPGATRLRRVPLDGSASTPVGPEGAGSGAVLSPDGTQVAFAKGDALHVGALAGTTSRIVARGTAPLANLSWSPDGARLAYTAGARVVRHEQTPDYSGAKIVYLVNENQPGRTFVVTLAGGALRELTEVGPSRRWLDATHLMTERTTPDFRHRITAVIDVTTAQSRVLNDDTEERFWSITGDAGANAQVSPDGKWVVIVSARSGWDHVYLVPTAGGPAVPVTSGRFEAWRPQWSPDGRRIVFDANVEGQYGTRHLYVATVNPATGQSTVEAITTGRGTNIAPQWSPDGTRLLYQHTDPTNSADVWMVEARPGATPRRVTDSMPAAVRQQTFVAPEAVSYPGPDGQPVPAWLFVPPNLDRSKPHPAIVWVHGDGVNQGYDGWHVQRNYAVYYSFHQYLLQQGYVVIAPDYRGSIGYGKSWREAVHMDVGGKDAKDAWMAAGYLKSLPYVDASRIGIWGLSYGGFFTLIAMTDQPTMFAAGVDVAGVVDYAMYYEDPYHGAWTASRIGTPQEHPEVYAQASPLSHVDRLARPLLVLHGTSDVNVPYLHSVRLIDEALKKGKGDLTSFMTYPGEFHYFTRAHVLRDAWQRVDRFFAEHLRP